MPSRIEVSTTLTDSEGNSAKKKIKNDLRLLVDEVKTIEVYSLDGDLQESELSALGKVLFPEEDKKIFSVNRPLANDFDWLIEVGYKPGVTDNVGRSTKGAIKDLISKQVDVYTSKQYVVKGALSRDQIKKISELFSNNLIERVTIKSKDEWDPEVGTGTNLPKVSIPHEPQINIIDLNVSDEELVKISKERVLALSLEEMKEIQRRFREMGRNPTDAELESLAQTWSEHCCHKIFNGEIDYYENGKFTKINSLFKTFIKNSTEKIRKSVVHDSLVSVFSDNAGIVKFDEEYNIAFKVETHNSPSALDPYGGAITGIVGVNRDIIGVGLGAKSIANTNVLCFGDPFYDGVLPDRIKHPKRVFEGVRKGIEHGGNKSGIPTVNGAVRFDSYPFGSVTEKDGTILSYIGKPLVFCGTVGIMPSQINGKSTAEKKANPGDLIVMTGGRIGKDGIHGATFSSESLNENSPATAVQIGDPITQKKMADMLLEARDLGLYTSITDNGAGGLSCSVGEMAKESGGAELYLDNAPLKYAGLDPWEILLSEAQERMTLSVPKKYREKFLELAKKHDVEATVMGEFTNSGRFNVKYKDKNLVDLEMEFLHDGVPKKKMTAKWEAPKFIEPEFEQPDIGKSLKGLLSRPNIASKEFLIRQYDHEVQGGTVIKPLVGAKNDGPGDASIVWPLEMQAKGSHKGIAVSNGINANYGLIDTYHMAAANLDEAIRNAIAVGADPNSLDRININVLDNFCWSSSDNEYRLAQLVRACQALYDNSIVFNAPLISGKDSMFNDYKGKLDGKDVKISVPPTLLISAMGIVPDIRESMTMDVKSPNHLVYVLGSTKQELGGSEYYAMLGAENNEAWIGNSVPKVNGKRAMVMYKKLHRAIENNYVSAVHDISEGGLGVALAEMSFAGGYGMDVKLDKLKTSAERDDLALFSESQSRFVVTVPEEYKYTFESTMTGSEFSMIGRTTENSALNIYGKDGNHVVHENLDDLKDSWQKTFRW